MHRPLPRGPRGSTILEAAIVLVMLGLLSAVALPRFLSSRARAHQAEARSNLKSWILAQRSFYEENARYEEEVGAHPTTASTDALPATTVEDEKAA